MAFDGSKFLEITVNFANTPTAGEPDVAFILYFVFPVAGLALHVPPPFIPPPNLAPAFNITQSEGGRFDHLIQSERPTARIFPDLGELVEADYARGHQSDLPAASGKLRVGLVHHGGKLTKNVRRILECVPRVPSPLARS